MITKDQAHRPFHRYKGHFRSFLYWQCQHEMFCNRELPLCVVLVPTVHRRQANSGCVRKWHWTMEQQRKQENTQELLRHCLQHKKLWTPDGANNQEDTGTSIKMVGSTISPYNHNKMPNFSQSIPLYQVKPLLTKLFWSVLLHN